MKFIAGEKYLIGGKHAHEDFYQEVVGQVLIYVGEDYQDAIHLLHQYTDTGLILHWYIRKEDLTPYSVNTNERGLLFLNKEEHI